MSEHGLTKTERNNRGPMPEYWRKRIQTGQILGRLQRHVNGELELSATQIRAAEILLRKTLPDLANVQVSLGNTNSIREVHITPVNTLNGQYTHINTTPSEHATEHDTAPLRLVSADK